MTLPDGIDVLSLVRRYEPVLRFTAGELFLPMSVETYVQGAALWGTDPGAGEDATLLIDHGKLDLDRLCTRANSSPRARLQLRYVPEPLPRRQLRAWRRDPDRPRLRSSTRFAAVGLFGRIIDAFVRLSLVLRGNVPGGLAAAAHQKYRAAAAGEPIPYYAHVSSDGGYLALQYWFFYAMNDWRSSFAGVNDHEADWEQVTIYLSETDGPGEWDATWVAFSAHDEVGSDVRRRRDDPDLTWVDGTHPVVYAGAGSHAGAYLPGEYLVRVEPTPLAHLFTAVAAIRGLLFPWTRGRPRHGLGIPYVDYKRGDGAQVGPGTDQPWAPVLIDDTTAWVRDFRGLWGLDTADPFGGERAPAGPRYNRDASIRECWCDPVAWAGLDHVPPTPVARSRVQTQRLSELERRRDQLDAQIAAQQTLVRHAASAFPGGPRTAARRGASTAEIDEQAKRLRELRTTRRALIVELEELRRMREHPIEEAPHAHLRRRIVPDVGVRAVRPGLLLRFWTEASLSVLLALIGVALLLDVASAPLVGLAAIFVVMLVEALLRRRALAFLLAVAIIVALAVAVWLATTNWRVGLGVLAILASMSLAVANLRALLARR